MVGVLRLVTSHTGSFAGRMAASFSLQDRPGVFFIFANRLSHLAVSSLQLHMISKFTIYDTSCIC